MREGTSSRGERAAERAEAEIASRKALWRRILSPLSPHSIKWSPKESHVLLHTEHEASGGAMGMPSQYLIHTSVYYCAGDGNSHSSSTQLNTIQQMVGIQYSKWLEYNTANDWNTIQQMIVLNK